MTLLVFSATSLLNLEGFVHPFFKQTTCVLVEKPFVGPRRITHPAQTLNFSGFKWRPMAAEKQHTRNMKETLAGGEPARMDVVEDHPRGDVESTTQVSHALKSSIQASLLRM